MQELEDRFTQLDPAQQILSAPYMEFVRKFREGKPSASDEEIRAAWRKRGQK